MVGPREEIASLSDKHRERDKRTVAFMKEAPEVMAMTTSTITDSLRNETNSLTRSLSEGREPDQNDRLAASMISKKGKQLQAIQFMQDQISNFYNQKREAELEG